MKINIKNDHGMKHKRQRVYRPGGSEAKTSAPKEEQEKNLKRDEKADGGRPREISIEHVGGRESD